MAFLSDFHSKSVLYGAFVWTRRAANRQARRVPARAVRWNCSSCVPPVVNGRANCSQGCLFNVARDPSERHELSQAEPQKLQELK